MSSVSHKTLISKRAPTMLTVGKRAGVSATTVSLVLRNHPSISEATRRRVIKAKDELGYRLNPYARDFVRQTRGKFMANPSLQHLAYCLINSAFESPAYLPFLHGIVGESQARKLRLSIQAAHLDGGRLEPSNLYDGGLDGVIVSGKINDACILCLQREKVPFVILGNYNLQTSVPCVKLDLRQAGRELVRDFSQRGHHAVAFAVENLDSAYVTESLDGIRESLAAQGIPLPMQNILVAKDVHASPSSLAESFLGLNPRPTSLITVDHRLADECTLGLGLRGLAVPGDVDMVTFAVSQARSRNSNCRALNLGLERLGRVAVRALAEVVHRPDGEDCYSSTLSVQDWCR